MGALKLKNRTWADQERRLARADARFLQQDRTRRAALLVSTIFGVAVLAAVASYLVWHASTSQDRATRESEIQVWRKRIQ